MHVSPHGSVTFRAFLDDATIAPTPLQDRVVLPHRDGARVFANTFVSAPDTNAVGTIAVNALAGVRAQL